MTRSFQAVLRPLLVPELAGSVVQLWGAGSAGYGSAAAPLLASITVIASDGTGAGGNAGNGFNCYPPGNFRITDDFTCPTLDSTPVYPTVTGGGPGDRANPNLALMTALDPCNHLVNIPFVNITELTTVAPVWALSPFMAATLNDNTSSAAGYPGTSATNTVGARCRNPHKESA